MTRANQCRKNYAILSVIMVCVISACYFITQVKTYAAYTSTLFIPDVYSDQSYAAPAYWAARHDYIELNDSGVFQPNNGCSRVVFAEMLWRYEDFPDSLGENIFTDTRRSTPIVWATEHDIIRGFNDGTFRPNEKITRMQACIMLWRWRGRPSASVTIPFTDIDHTNSGYRAAQWCNENGLIKGFSDGTFRPEETCTRAQIAIILYRYARDCDGIDVSTDVPENLHPVSEITLPEIDNDWIEEQFGITSDDPAFNTTKDYVFKVKEIEENLGIQNGMTDYQAYLLITNWIMDYMEYDFNYLNYQFNDILDWKCGTCMAYADMLALMCRISGIECEITVGTANEELHAWNRVCIGGKWYWADLTLSDSLSNTSGVERQDLWQEYDVQRVNRFIQPAEKNNWNMQEDNTPKQARMLSLTREKGYINKLVSDVDIKVSIKGDVWFFRTIEGYSQYRIAQLDKDRHLIQMNESIRYTPNMDVRGMLNPETYTVEVFAILPYPSN